MELPDLTASQIQQAIPQIQDLGNPLRGGQKVVYPATIDGQRCALKIMLTNPLPADELDYDEDSFDEVTARAQREVDIMAQCDSPYLVKLGPLPLTHAEVGGQQVIYFAEEWIDGRNVREIIVDDGPLSLEDVVPLGTQVAEAVKILWSLAKIHRDIKPGNIMRRDSTGEFVLLDMGLAFDLYDDSLTRLGLVPGTPFYFSPERMELDRKRQMDFRSDLFSLGIVLYEAATGQHPFWLPGLSREQVLGRILRSNPEPPSSHRRGIPQEMDAVILRLLAKKPHLRYRTCQLLVDALSRIST